MAITTFIPKVWSAKLLENLNNELVYSKLLNRDYEGEISQYGDTVHINSIGGINIKKYTKNTDIDGAEELSTEEQLLVIDQSNYFNFGIDDIDKVQARADLISDYTAEASYGLAEKADEYVAGLLAKGTLAPKNLGSTSTPLVIDTPDKAYRMLVDMKVALDKSKLPKAGRWVVVPPEMEGLMLLDPRFAYNTGKAEGRLENGAVARAVGFDIHIANTVPNTGGNKFKIIASSNMCATYAEQILETKAYSPEKRFGDALKGLHVFGAKVTRPNNIAVATVNFTSEVV